MPALPVASADLRIGFDRAHLALSRCGGLGDGETDDRLGLAHTYRVSAIAVNRPSPFAQQFPKKRGRPCARMPLTQPGCGTTFRHPAKDKDKDGRSNRTTADMEATIAPREAASKAMVSGGGWTGGVTAHARVRAGRFRVLREADLQDCIGRAITPDDGKSGHH